MNKLLIIYLLALVFVLGCRSHQASGSLGDFVLKRITAYGGTPPPLSATGKLPAHWTYTEDRHGILITTRDVSFEEVDRFLRDAYGNPTEGGKTPDGHNQWVIPARVSGVAIWYAKTISGVQININPPLKLD